MATTPLNQFGITEQSHAARVARRLSRLLAVALLTCAVAPVVAAQDDDEALDLSRLIFEVAPIPPDEALPGTVTGAGAAGGAAVPGIGTQTAPSTATPARTNLAADISAHRARIADTQANENPYSAALREQFDALGLLLQETGNHEDAIAAFESAMHIDRVNAGLYTLDQIPVVEKIIASHEALGNSAEVNDLHAYLFYIQQKSYADDDPRLLAAKEEWADWNVESYLKEPPPEGFLSFGTGIPSSIDRTAGYVAVQTRDGSFVYVPRSYIASGMSPFGNGAVFDPMFMSTYSVEAENVVDERLRTARDYYEEIIEAKAAGAVVPGAGPSATEAYRVEHKLANVAFAVKSQLEGVDTIADQSSLYFNRALGMRHTLPRVVTRGYTQNRETLEAIAQELEQNPAATAVEKAQAYIRLGDWSVAYDYGSRAEEAYGKAWQLLSDAGIDAAMAADIFMPQPLVAAPDFVIHRYSRESYGFEPGDTLAYKGHMDLTLSVSRYGDVSGVDIDAATPGTLQVVRTELLDYLRRQKVRPAVIDGETVKREDVKLRYYYSY